MYNVTVIKYFDCHHVGVPLGSVEGTHVCRQMYGARISSVLAENLFRFYVQVYREFDDPLPFESVKSPSMHCQLHVAVALAILKLFFCWALVTQYNIIYSPGKHFTQTLHAEWAETSNLITGIFDFHFQIGDMVQFVSL